MYKGFIPKTSSFSEFAENVTGTVTPRIKSLGFN